MRARSEKAPEWPLTETSTGCFGSISDDHGNSLSRVAVNPGTIGPGTPRTQRMIMEKINVPGLARLPAFCHAVVAGDFIYVSGTLGTMGDSTRLEEGGAGPQTRRALCNIEIILGECGASLTDLVKVNVYLADMGEAREMNAAYVAVIGTDPPARITVARADLALDAAVEIDAVAFRPLG